MRLHWLMHLRPMFSTLRKEGRWWLPLPEPWVLLSSDVHWLKWFGQDKVQIISCTGANLEEDIMNLVAHSHYKRVPNYRDLSPQDEWDLLENHYNRVTDMYTEEEAFRRLQNIWSKYGPMLKKQEKGISTRVHVKNASEWWPWTILWNWSTQQLDVGCRWKNIPIVVPGWEDSTMGNIFASYCIKKDSSNLPLPKVGLEYMMWLADWYV